VKLTVTTDGHGVTYPSVTVAAPANAKYWVSAAPLNGWEFSCWTVVSGSATFTNAKEAVAQAKLGTANTTVKATFKAVSPTMYNLSVTGDGHGSVFPAGVSKVNAGQTIYIGATPAAGYVFSSWSVTAGKATFATESSGAMTVKLVGGSATIKANFKAKPKK
jgi:hypothetical protein